MQSVFKQGDIKVFETIVSEKDFAVFESGVVHKVYSTFALTRDAEWSGRLFVLEMKKENEEGVGTYISVRHKSPAFVGDRVRFVASFEKITDKGEIINSFQAFVGQRLIAEGEQGQRIFPKEKIDSIFSSFQ